MKSKIRVANNLPRVEGDIYKGTIVSLGFGEGKRTEKHGRDIEEIVYPRFEMITEFEGTIKPIKITTFTGTSINAEPVETRYEGRGAKNEVKIYNRFTSLLLKLDLVKESDLEKIDDTTIEEIEQNLEALKGTMIQCKIGKDKGGFLAIDLESVELLK
jgi:hypothetical protein